MKIKMMVGVGFFVAVGVGLLPVTVTPSAPLKVFISVDMEGIGGVIAADDVRADGQDYALFRRLMTEEANAAVAGALDAGAGEILVRDAHGSGRNILPDLLHPAARLVRDWSGGPLSMMEGLDASFSAVVFIGYHSRAGTADGVLSHTMSSALVYDVKLNGRALPEAGINGLIAGYFDVPVVLVSGDQAIARQAREIFPAIETVVVKEGRGRAAVMLHPEKCRRLIREKIASALKNLVTFKPYRPPGPYTLEIVFKHEANANLAANIPGAVRSGDRSASFTSADLLEAVKFLRTALSL